MNWLKKGPDLKMPDLKVPDPLVDLYWDLRDRHLLPLVVLAIVAIVAVPFVLAGGSKQGPGPAPAVGRAIPSPEPTGSKLAVVEAKPGLRDYRKRLRRNKPTNPFKQRYTSPVLKGTKLGGGSTTSTGGGSKTTVTQTKSPNGTTTTEVTTETGSGSGSGGGGAETSPGRTLYTFAADLKIVRTTTTADGAKKQEPPVVKHHVIPPEPLPSEKYPVVAYIGYSPKTHLASFLISEAVTGVFGDGKCVAGTSRCQLIQLEQGIPETFIVGEGGPRYKINLLKVEPVPDGHL